MSRNAMIAFVALAACGGGSDGGDVFPADAYEHVTSANGTYAIEVRTSPQPPRVGVGAVELRVRDRGGVAADGLSFQVTPVMPAHAHGASVKPTVVVRGGGVYVLDGVSTYMAGAWELRTTIEGSSGNDDVVIPLDVR